MIAAGALIAILLLVALTVVFYGPWQELCTDFARQVVFEKRDAIFDMARANRIAFDSEEYRTIRSALEKSIRFAHELTWLKLVIMYVALKRIRGLPRKTGPQQAIEKIRDTAVRKEVQKLFNEAYVALFVMTALKSAIFLVFGIALGLILCVIGVTGSIVRKPVRWLSRVIEAEPESLRV